MKATVVTMTPELAKDYLSRNTQNRRIKQPNLIFIKNQMLKGKWKENGEAIIIDSNGVIKDGQHRLMAIAETKLSFQVVVVSGVNPKVMDTIDTGSNRSASDVLYLEGFKHNALLASCIKAILKNSYASLASSQRNVQISNADILNYAKKHKEYLYELIKTAKKISSLQVANVLTDTIIVYYLHKYNNTDTTYDFLLNISGTRRKPQSATDYVYKKLFKASTGEERLSHGDKAKYIEKSYEYFIKGNQKVVFLRINDNKEKVA